MNEMAMTSKTYTIWRTSLIVGTVIGLGGISGEMVWSAEKDKLKEIEVVAMAASANVLRLRERCRRRWEASPVRLLRQG